MNINILQLFGSGMFVYWTVARKIYNMKHGQIKDVILQ